MFYEQNQILSVLNCSKCSKEFDEPRLLPCGNTVCNECILTLTNKKKSNSNTFQCTICADEHLIPSKGFPINKSLLKVIEQKPKEVFRGKVVEEFKLNLEIISKKKERFEFQLNNGIDTIKEKCMNLRCDVHASSEKAILRIVNFTDSMISEINKYENECISSFQTTSHQSKVDQKKIFEQLIKQVDKFHIEWSNYLKNLQLNEDSVLKANNFGLTLLKKLNEDEIILKNFIYDYKFIEFKANTVEMEKNILGSIIYTQVNRFQFKETISLKNVEHLKNTSVDSIVVDIDEDGSIILYFYYMNQTILYSLKLNKNLKLKVIHYKVISNYLEIPSKKKMEKRKSLENNFVPKVFKKYKDKILTLNNQNSIEILNKNYEVIFKGAHEVSGPFIFCMNEENLFFLLFNQLKIMILKQEYLHRHNAYNICSDVDYIYNNDYNNDISYQVYQSTDPNKPFYFPSDIKQFECVGGKFIWLNETKLQILNEKTGKVENSIILAADKFILNSKYNICLINKTTQSLQIYQTDGQLLTEYQVQENLLDQPFFLDKKDKFIFFNKNNFDLHLQ